MTDKADKTVHIKWVRSGIGFPRKQKVRVKSLGLGRLNQIVERPDTPQIRGLVESIPHLVEIVEVPAKPAWMSVPEVTIHPPDPAAAPAPKPARKPKPVEEEPEVEKAEAAAKPEKTSARAEQAKKEKEKKPVKAAAAKSKKDDKEKKSKAAKAKPAKKTKK